MIFEGLVEAGLITKVEFQGRTYLVRRFARGRRRHKVLSLSMPLLGVGPRLDPLPPLSDGWPEGPTATHLNGSGAPVN
jgi:hypothetical protein